ncbi:hypothetical protein BCR35DRAFT_306069 [Leucosporidium creatinivorum]|uniref:NAD(P)-binding protein n=1 Tax=Leucosporidium creatinivorum TaxID=106004 RepID=A0A1Y2EY18_9BASI|nr:hypothetical protein BCR35DRAFT_306069 [Leucosporidium creatinivorum]
MPFNDFMNKRCPNSAAVGLLFPPTPTFKPDSDIPDLSGKVFIVTGANIGIGYETVKQLLLHNPQRVYLAARSEEKANAAIEKLREETGNGAGTGGQLVYLKVDLSDLNSVRAAASEFLSKEKQLDVLINNAGVMAPPLADLTAQGYDLQFGTNVLGHYYFTKLLLPALVASHASAGEPARIVTVSSAQHKSAAPGSGIAFETLKGGAERDAAIKKFGMMPSMVLYGQSKLGNVFLSSIFAESHPGVVVSASIDPGAIESNLQQHMTKGVTGAIYEVISSLLVQPVAYGALSSLYAATVADPVELNGKLFVPWARIGEPSEQAKNVETRERVKDWLEEQLAEL